MNWIYRGEVFEEIPPKAIGFVYLITHLKSGKMYIGKKLFWTSKTKQTKGKKKKIKVESDWRDYWSSSDSLKEMVTAEGQSSFCREILHIVFNKGALNYLEAREQFDRRVLENPDLYWNGQIQVRVHWTHVFGKL